VKALIPARHWFQPKPEKRDLWGRRRVSQIFLSRPPDPEKPPDPFPNGPKNLPTLYSSSSGSEGLLVAKSSTSVRAASGESSSRLNERPVLLSGIGPRGRSLSFFLALALVPR